MTLVVLRSPQVTVGVGSAPVTSATQPMARTCAGIRGMNSSAAVAGSTFDELPAGGLWDVVTDGPEPDVNDGPVDDEPMDDEPMDDGVDERLVDEVGGLAVRWSPLAGLIATTAATIAPAATVAAAPPNHQRRRRPAGREGAAGNGEWAAGNTAGAGAATGARGRTTGAVTTAGLAYSAPWATTSSGCSMTVGAMPRALCRRLAARGTRLDPPTRNTPATCSRGTPAPRSVASVTSTVLPSSGRAALSNSSRVRRTSVSKIGRASCREK